MAQVLNVSQALVKGVEKLIIDTEDEKIWVTKKQFKHLTQGKIPWEDLVGCNIMYSYFKAGEKSGNIEVTSDNSFLKTLAVVTSNTGMMQVALTEGAAKVIEKFSMVKAIKTPSFNASKFFDILRDKPETEWQELLEDEGLTSNQVKQVINEFAAHLAKFSTPDPAGTPF